MPARLPAHRPRMPAPAYVLAPTKLIWGYGGGLGRAIDSEARRLDAHANVLVERRGG